MVDTELPSDIPRRRFTVADFYRLMDVGIIAADERVELLDGIVMTLPPMSDRASATTARMKATLAESLGTAGAVVTQTPIILTGDSQIVTDLAVVGPDERFYASGKPTVADAHVLIDISDNPLRFDRNKRLNLYARARVPAYWVVNLQDSTIEIYREPLGCGYRSSLNYQGTTYIEIPAAHTFLTVEDLIGV